MTENWRSVVGFVHDSLGPDRDPIWTPRALNSAGVQLKRDTRASLQKRDPHRSASENKAVLSTYSVEWDFPITSAQEYLIFLLAYVADAGRIDIGDPDYVYKIGRGKDPPRAHIYLDGVDGSHYKAASCILTDLTINVDLLQAVRAETTWAARALEIEGSAYSWPDVAPTNARPATARDSLVTIGLANYPVFGWSVGFQREADPGGLDEDGTASAWTGRLTFDIGGKLVCRCTAEDFEEALITERIDPIETVIQLPGGGALTLTFPRCVIRAESKRVVSPELYEYALEWAAIQENDGDCATLTLSTS